MSYAYYWGAVHQKLELQREKGRSNSILKGTEVGNVQYVLSTYKVFGSFIKLFYLIFMASRGVFFVCLFFF